MKTAYVKVVVASVWTKPNLPRDMDIPATLDPVDIPAWLSNMTYEDKLWLVDQDILQTQVLYGGQVLVTEEADGWSHVLVPGQYTPKNEVGYPGWIPSNQLTYDPTYDEYYQKTESVWVTVPKAELHLTGETLSLAYMTRLPFLRVDQDRVFVALPTGGEGWLPATDVTVRTTPHQVEKPYLQAPFAMLEKQSGEKIVEAGKQFMALPYLWSGMSSYGYDCSGFSHSMHKACGMLIPRDASVQFKYGKEHGLEVSKEDMLPGDLVYFMNEKGFVHHVGIYAGDGQFLHAPNSKNAVTIQPLWEGKYGDEFCGAIRYW